MRGKTVAIFLVGMGLGFLLAAFCVSPEVLENLRSSAQDLASQMGVSERLVETTPNAEGPLDPVGPPPVPIPAASETGTSGGAGKPEHDEAEVQQGSSLKPEPVTVSAAASKAADSPPRATARQILERAVGPEVAADPDRAAFLFEVALNRALEEPEQFVEAWSLIQDRFPESAESQDDAVLQTRFGLFLTKLDNALSSVDDPVLFDALWNTRAAVKARVLESPADDPLRVSREDGPQVIAGPTARQTLEASIRSEETGEAEKARFLLRAALNSARREPDQFLDLWPVFSQRMTEGGVGQEDSFSQEGYWALLEGLDDILETVQDRGLFDRLWEVRLEMTRRVAEPEVEGGQDTTAIDLDRLRQMADDCEAATEIARIVDLLNGSKDSQEDADSLVGLLERTIGVSGAEEDSNVSEETLLAAQKSLDRILETIIKRAEVRFAEIENKCIPEWRKDKDGVYTKPAGGGGKGAYWSLLDQTQTLGESLMAINLEQYVSMNYIKQGSPILERTYKLLEKMGHIEEQLRTYQQIRYNLWAVARINKLEATGEDKIELIGEISVELLYPPISGYYGKVYDLLLSSRAGDARGLFVRDVLVSSRITLDQF